MTLLYDSIVLVLWQMLGCACEEHRLCSANAGGYLLHSRQETYSSCEHFQYQNRVKMTANSHK